MLYQGFLYFERKRAVYQMKNNHPKDNRNVIFRWRAFTHKHLGVYGVIYFAASFIALLVAIPMWINAGLFG